MLTNKEMKPLVLMAAAVLVAGSARAQGLGNSPYSRIGLGEYNANTGGVRQMAIGGTGVAALRVLKDNHWLSDVLAGAGVGLYFGWRR